jgi:Calcineurin-like phosphoesterase
VRLTLFLVACNAAVIHPCASSVTKGPWVERVDETHATILWESADKGCVEAEVDKRVVVGTAVETHVVGSFGAGLPKPDEPGTYYRNEVALDGLTGCPSYRVRASGTKAQAAGDLDGRFCTARSPGADFTFLATADTDPILGHTVPTMMKVLPENPDFIVHGGDVQYYSAIAETWAYWFGAMAPLLRQGAFYPAVGNHESESPTEFDDYYDRLFAKATTELTEPWFHFSSGGVHFFALDTENSSLDAGSEQVTWLQNSLAAAQASPGFRFSVVYYHRPLYTVGDSSPQLNARMVLEPIFLGGGVALVIQGHMHGYERFEVPNGLTYVTCAGGGAVIDNVNQNVSVYPADAALRVASSDRYHMCLFYVSAGKLSSKVVAEDGSVLDQFEKPVP